MKVNDFLLHLDRRIVSSDSQEGKLAVAAEEIGSFFGVHAHEIGLFRVDEERKNIEFCWPPSMADVSHIPLNAFNSLVAKTALERQGYIDNSFAHSRHLFILEHFLANKDERIPIQKVMSVPIIIADKVVGVVQVVRKGETLAVAGADFSKDDLIALEQIVVILGQHKF